MQSMIEAHILRLINTPFNQPRMNILLPFFQTNSPSSEHDCLLLSIVRPVAPTLTVNHTCVIIL